MTEASGWKRLAQTSHIRLLGLGSNIMEHAETSDEQSTFSCQVHSACLSGGTYKIA